ncbi:hypothetical protein WBQ28_02725 [Pseudomonas syringae pv. syringae]|uniref:hypothetical protein n=1 Tax=Pseudomonas syringae TaxID=317 RepID=UPI003B00F6FC
MLHDFDLQRELNRSFLRVSDLEHIGLTAWTIAAKRIVFFCGETRQLRADTKLLQHNAPAFFQRHWRERRRQIALQGDKAFAEFFFSNHLHRWTPERGSHAWHDVDAQILCYNYFYWKRIFWLKGLIFR